MRIVLGNFPGPRKKNKKKLFFTLICAELLGILVLVWFLRAPLYEKFLAQPPKAYDSSKMQTNKQYLVSQNDQIVGKAEPDTKIKFYLSPLKQITTSRTDSQGVWNYQIPRNLPAGKYQLYVAFFGTSKEVLIKNFHFRVVSRGTLEKTIFGFNITSNVFAQDDGEIISEILSDEPVIDPLSQPATPASGCPETGCPESGLETVISQPSRCDPDIPGNIIQINSDTQEEESVNDESGLCSDPEILGDGTANLFFFKGDFGNDLQTAALDIPTSCPTLEDLENNVDQCRLLNPAIDVVTTYFDPEIRQKYIDLYEKEFVGKEIFVDYVPGTVNSDELNILGNQTRQELLDKGYLIHGDKVYMTGTPEEFERRVDFIIKKSKELYLNPVIFLGYWKPESYFSTAEGADFGCFPYLENQGFGAPRKSFERELYCALGLNPKGEIPGPEESKTGSSGPMCALSANQNSRACRRAPGNRNVRLVPTTFDDLFVLHADFKKTKGVISSGDCKVSYNQTLEVITRLGACNARSPLDVQIDFSVSCDTVSATPPRRLPNASIKLVRDDGNGREDVVWDGKSNEYGEGSIYFKEPAGHYGISYKIIPEVWPESPYVVSLPNFPTDSVHEAVTIEIPTCPGS